MGARVVDIAAAAPIRVLAMPAFPYHLPAGFCVASGMAETSSPRSRNLI